MLCLSLSFAIHFVPWCCIAIELNIAPILTLLFMLLILFFLSCFSWIKMLKSIFIASWVYIALYIEIDILIEVQLKTSLESENWNLIELPQNRSSNIYSTKGPWWTIEEEKHWTWARWSLMKFYWRWAKLNQMKPVEFQLKRTWLMTCCKYLNREYLKWIEWGSIEHEHWSYSVYELLNCWKNCLYWMIISIKTL